MRPDEIDRFVTPMQCDPDCGMCCGITAVPVGEYQWVMDYAKKHNIEPRRQGIDCPWLHDGRCAVYDARPSVCRFYGHTPRMRCPRGYNTDVSEGVETHVFARMKSDIVRQGATFLHNAAYRTEELEPMVKRAMKGASPATTLTVDGIPLGNRPDTKHYSAARTLKLAGIGFSQQVFLDDQDGSIT